MADKAGGSSGDKTKQERRKALRNKIQRSIEIAKEENRRELLRRRIDLARSGLKHYEQKRYTEAAKAFLTYLRILEDWKGVATGSLHPGLFDTKKDVPELLLINSVYWHLTKLYDQLGVESDPRAEQFTHYLDKFTLFTKGMPFQPLASETLRKYLRHRNIRHRDRFKAAYKTITGTSCFVVSSLSDVCEAETVGILQTFRDERLSQTWVGRAMIRGYYACGPSLARAVDRFPEPARAALGGFFDRLARLLTEKSLRDLE